MSPELSARVAKIEASLGGSAPALDAELDLGGAVRALGEAGPVWLRVGTADALPPEGAYLAVPGERRWVRLDTGPTLAPLPSGEAAPAPLAASRVELAVREVAWGTAAAPLRRAIARVVLQTDGAPLEVASAIAEDGESAAARLAPIAHALATRLGVAAPEAPGDAARDATTGPSLDARAFARWTLGWEEDRLVLRDLESAGPREGALVWALVSVGSLAGAGVAGAFAVAAWQAGAPWAQLAARAGITLVFLLGAFAFFHVARHAFRYRAAGTPIAVFADDRVVVLPWVSRRGAVDPRPEGRFGAGVRAHEVNRVHVVPRGGRHWVSLDTEHGPIDVTDAPTADQGEALRAIVERSLAGVSSGRKRRPAAARGRERAAAPG